jgi:hypothetical protein
VRVVCKPLRSNAQTLRYARELGARMQEVERRLVYSSARYVFDEIVRRLSGPRFADYVRALKLVEVAGNEPAYAIYAKPLQKRVRKLDPTTTGLYVVPITKRVAKVPEYVFVLERYSPWTMGTLPVFPSKRDARLVYRTLREEETEAVRKRNEAARTEWAKELTKLGVTPKKNIEFPAKGKAVPDLAFEALRIEYGLGDGAGRSHWRPALQALAKGQIARMLENEMDLMDPAITNERVTQEVEGVISSSEAAGFAGFAKRLRT